MSVSEQRSFESAVAYHPQRTITITSQRDPLMYFRHLEGELHVQGFFADWILPKAQPVAAGTNFVLDHYQSKMYLTDAQVETYLLKDRLADESTVCAVIAELLESEPRERLQDYAFYTEAGIVGVGWPSLAGDGQGWARAWVGAWTRDKNPRPIGMHFLSPVE